VGQRLRLRFECPLAISARERTHLVAPAGAAGIFCRVNRVFVRLGPQQLGRSTRPSRVYALGATRVSFMRQRPCLRQLRHLVFFSLHAACTSTSIYTPPGKVCILWGGMIPPMVGYTKDKRKIGARLRRIEGQVRGIEKMVDEDRYCIDVLTQVNATRAAIESVALH